MDCEMFTNSFRQPSQSHRPYHPFVPANMECEILGCLTLDVRTRKRRTFLPGYHSPLRSKYQAHDVVSFSISKPSHPQPTLPRVHIPPVSGLTVFLSAFKMTGQGAHETTLDNEWHTPHVDPKTPSDAPDIEKKLRRRGERMKWDVRDDCKAFNTRSYVPTSAMSQPQFTSHANVQVPSQDRFILAERIRPLAFRYDPNIQLSDVVRRAGGDSLERRNFHISTQPCLEALLREHGGASSHPSLPIHLAQIKHQSKSASYSKLSRCNRHLPTLRIPFTRYDIAGNADSFPAIPSTMSYIPYPMLRNIRNGKRTVGTKLCYRFRPQRMTFASVVSVVS
ncbi:hypothetical protein Hypma_008371 [Hypsizygus marmoreus]|uniref:Uncharacterized protein n=1 Tax=Hypsizygus marmoreus TaxID=39966 RepID=A0A369JVK0_HYPMA|nr:hypothetical protein Hypma_008371 [Hypsizygus marmoreus]